MARPDSAAPVESGHEFRVADPHALASDDVLERLRTSAQGLSDAEAAERREQLGPNALPEKKRRTVFAMLADQFKDFLILLLLAAAAISGVIGETIDTIAILVIVVLNAIIGVVQEYRAERAIEALREMAGNTAAVRREGRVREIPAEELTLGDVVLLEAGQVVPADVRVIESAALRVAEAALTGESLPVEKATEPTAERDQPIGDRTSMAYKGTQIVHGRGVGVAAAIGAGTEIGKIAGLIGGEDEKTPLQKRLAQFGRTLGIAAVGLCAVVFGVGVAAGEEALQMFLVAVSLAVAAVPEALPAVATITLALGARRLVKTNTLVRKLPSVETLGSVTFICTDKTGTLTLNEMTVERLAAADAQAFELPSAEEDASEARRWLGKALALSNDVAGEGDELVGDPTEVAFVRAAAEGGYRRSALEPDLPRAQELPFDSDRKLMTTIHQAEGEGYVSFTKGAAEAVMDRSAKGIASDGSESPLDRAAADRLVDDWSAEGLRVLAFGMRRLAELPAEGDFEAVENDLTLLGLVGLLDPPRAEAAEAVATCIEAGIVPVMITGDHPATASAIAKRIGIVAGGDQVFTGAELEAMPLDEFENRVERIRIYARVAPEQKLKIVRALQDKGEFVAMTGDGVNDAPALSNADIGIAMGITGTDVAKEAADMVLLDDNFSSIVGSVREGRRIFDNIRKFVRYTLTSNSGEIWTILFAPLIGLPVPLLPIHILWINLVTDGLPGLALSAEPHEKDVMERPPRPPKESIFARGLAIHVLWVGLLMGGVSLFTQFYAIRFDDVPWQTMVFTVLCLSQMGQVLAIRSERESLFTLGLRSNMPLLGAVALTFVLQMATVYVPFLQPVFRTEALSALELGAVLALSTVVFWAVETDKWITRRLHSNRAART